MAEQRRLTLRREIAGTIRSGLNAPKALVEAKNRYDNEQRSIDYVAARQRARGRYSGATPGDDGEYFDEHKMVFRAPEYRKLVLVSVSPADPPSPIEMSDADVKTLLSSHRRARFARPSGGTFSRSTSPTPKRPAQPRTHRERRELRRRGEGAWQERKGYRPRYRPQIRDHRPSGRRCCLCAQGRRGQRAGQGQLRHRAGACPQIEPEQFRPFAQVAAELKQELAAAARQTEIFDVYTRSRTHAQRATAGRGRRHPQAGSTHGRGRSLRPRPGRQRRCSYPPRSVISRRGFHHRHRGRARSVAVRGRATSGTTSPGSPLRASARSTKSRLRSKRAGASSRSPPASTQRQRASSTSSKPTRRFPIRISRASQGRNA